MPRRIEIGDIVSTSYGTGPYKVTKVMRGCTCSSYVQYINDDETPSREHMHIVCRSEGDKTDSWLNGYDADLKSVWGDDYLILHDAAPVQSTMF